jgi:exosome complex component RRP4
MAMTPDKNRRPQLVVPGDVLDDTGQKKAGNYTYTRDGKIMAARLGILRENGNFLNIIPLNGVYNPAAGDQVVGIVMQVGPSNWLIDINAPYPAPMHVSETPWDVEFGETAEFLRAGDAVSCKVLFVDENRRIQVTLKEAGLQKLNGGQIIEVAPSKVARVIGSRGSMVNMIKNYTDVWSFIGQNGRLWLNGEPDMILVAINAIRLVEREAHLPGLTQKVEAYLKKTTGRTGDEEAPVEAEAN